MPRQRPLRQPADNPNFPDTGSVIVDLTAAGPEPPARTVYGSSVAAITAAISSSPVVNAHGTISPDINVRQPSVTARSDAVAPPPPDNRGGGDDGDEDDYSSLRKAEERARGRNKELEQQSRTDRAWGQEQANRAAAAVHALQESQLDTIETALAAAEGKIDAATQAWADAMARGDFMAAGRFQRTMNDAQRDIDKLKDGKDELAVTVRQKPMPAQPPRSPTSGIEDTLARMPNLIDSEREWIRNHPESLGSFENQQRMQVAFRDATARNLKRGSQEYFDFFNERMGYEDEGGDVYEEEPPPMRQSRRETRTQPGSVRVAAPPSRSGGGALRPGQLVLTEKQREAARIAGVDEVTYARGVQRMMEMKAAGMYGASEQK
jgi:hypothetical protein